MNLNRIKLLFNYYNSSFIESGIKLSKHSTFSTISRKLIKFENNCKFKLRRELFYCKNYCSCKESLTELNSANLLPDTTKIPAAGTGKYKLFQDFDSPVILDIEEERQLRLTNPEAFQEETEFDEFAGLNLNRGIRGVYDVEELVKLLRHDGAQNIIVVKVPRYYKYVDHMVIVTAKSYRHMFALAEFIKKLFKKKKHADDFFPVIEGKQSREWMAIDLGNIALHFFSADARAKYDIESLWALGSKYDDITNQKEDEYITFLQQHTALSGLTPLEPETPKT